MASEIRVNSLTNRSGLSTVSITDTGAVVAGLVTATTFSGPLTGAVTGNVTGDLTGNVTGNVTGNLTGNVTGTATTATALSGSPSITVTDVTATGNVSIGGTLTYEDVTNIDAVGIITAQSDVLVGRNLSVTSGISTVKSLDYAAIDTTISDTAVDVFIYDTSKDSDGGAWRKRTQHTSWYNETLNTVTRGSRREFPAVAVIVTTATNVTIYDGDDPDLPMWMNFQSGSYYFIGPGNRVKNSAHMLNGILCVTKSGSISWMSYISFIDDTARQYSDNDGEKRDYLVPISYRNSSNANAVVNSIQAYTIVNDATNDVAMTVLPNAPIDDATGLPIPTIAVATVGGISIIKDDGNVYDSGDGLNWNFIDISETKGRKVLNYGFSNGATVRHKYIDSISSDYGSGALDVDYEDYPNGTVSVTAANDVYASQTRGIAIYDRWNDPGSYNNTNYDDLLAFVTSDYNTGWMHGNIKGAFLSDTDATNVTGSELVTNGTFDTDTTGWSATDATLSVSGGELIVTRTAHSQFPYQSFTTVVGKTYTFTAQVKDGTDTSVSTYIAAGTSAGDQSLGTTSGSATITSASFQSISLTFTASSTTTYIMLHSLIGADGETVIWDNVSVRIADPDRSVNNNGLQVFGTVTKSAVATGADLIAYSGWSSSNYLLQPLNSDLAFGNNAFSVMCWFKTSQDHSATDSAILIAGDDGSNQLFDLRVHSDEKLLWQVTDDGFSTRSRIYQAGPAVDDGIWHCVVATRTSDNKTHLYLDGNLIGSSTSESAQANLSNSIAFSIGIENAYDGTKQKPWGGSIALARISESVPSAEQVKKMYEDEKVLFQENAKATLYGSSDAVTALAYDDDTDLLHVGTSSGRSDFQGLRRINNTTTAVTTAITAQNEFIIEQ